MTAEETARLEAQAAFFPSFLEELDAAGTDLESADRYTRWPWSRVFADDNTAESMAHNLAGFVADLLDKIEELTEELAQAETAYEAIDAIERRDPWQLADAIEAATHYRVPVALVPSLLGGPR